MPEIGNDTFHQFVINAIKSIVDLIKPETDKIDNAAAIGLLGTHNSVAYRTNEIERHLHGDEKWFGLAASSVAETHRADRMNGVIQPFRLTAGNSAFGNWVQIIGSSDTPVRALQAYFDFHRIIVANSNSTNMFIVQIISGESADFAAKIAAEQFSEFPFISLSKANDSGITEIMTFRVAAGEKVWMRCACVGANATWLDLYFGIHEYEG